MRWQATLPDLEILYLESFSVSLWQTDRALIEPPRETGYKGCHSTP